MGHTHTHTHSHTKNHTTTQPIRGTHKLSHKHTTFTQATSTQTMAMYVKNPKHYFGYHDISNSSKNNQNLRFSKNHNSKKKTQNTSSTSRAIHSKKKAGRIYPQENLKSGRTVQNKRIPGIPPRASPGGQAACKHPKDSQVGIQNTRSFTEQRNKKLNNTPTTIGVDKPKRKLFSKNIVQNPTVDNMVPKGTDLEILLINSCKINALKVQDIVEHFIKGKTYI